MHRPYDAPQPGGTAGTYLSPNWVQTTPTAPPIALSFAASAYDAKNNQVVLFGGTTGTTASTAQARTWLWANNVWTEQKPATSPPATYDAAMAFDQNLQQVVMFGGVNSSGASTNDVWTWTGSTWTKLSTTGKGPTARNGASMAWDPDYSALVVFGGFSATPYAGGPSGNTYNDTYTLTLSASSDVWTPLIMSGTLPLPRTQADLGYTGTTTTSSTQMVMFGGITCPQTSGCIIGSMTPVNETWILTGSKTNGTWTKQTLTSAPPPPRLFASMTFDAGLGGLVVFGGKNSSGLLQDTWAWNGATWLLAAGIASPAARYGQVMAATAAGQLVMFGGEAATGSSFQNDTWTYDTRIPVLSVAVTQPSGAAPASPIYYAGDTVLVTVTAANTGVFDIADAANTTVTSALNASSLLAPGSGVVWSGTPGCTLPTTHAVGSVANLIPTIVDATVGAACKAVGQFLATVVGSTQGCSLVNVPVSALNAFGTSAPASTGITVCGGGLGTEDYYSYDSTALGPGSTANVNVANGNLVVKSTDSTNETNHGDLGFSLSRAYNSQDNMNQAGPLGAGWQFNIGATSDDVSAALSLGSLIVPTFPTSLNSTVSQLLDSTSQPLSVTYRDRDGTRHIFSLRSLSINGAAVGATNLGGLLDPANLLSFVSLPSTFQNLAQGHVLCVDASYSAPPGLDMSLYRYVDVNLPGASSCTGSSDVGAATIGWTLMRPDRLRYDFDAAGHLLDEVDGAGNKLVYDVDKPTGNILDMYSAACKPAASPSTNPVSGPACPKYSFDPTQPAPQNFHRLDVTDPAGRVTTYIVSAPTALGAVPELTQVWNPDNPYSLAPTAVPSVAYTYSSSSKPCGNSANGATSVGMLCSASDPLGGVTTFTYTPAPLGPDRVMTVTDRRANLPISAPNGNETLYTYNDAGKYVTADSSTPKILGSAVPPTGCVNNAQCERTQWAGIDSSGRVAEIDDGDASGMYVHQTAYFWDGTPAIASCRQPDAVVDNNLCETISRGAPSNAPFALDTVTNPPAVVNGVTVPDHATRYLYNEQGDVLRKQSIIDPTAGWTTANTSTTTYGTHAQYIRSDPNSPRLFNDSVAGSGNVYSTTTATQAYRTAVGSDSPVGYYRLNELSGSVAQDSSPACQASSTACQNLTYGGGVPLGQSGAIPGDLAVGDPGPTWTASAPSFANFANGTGKSSAFTVESWQKTSDTGSSYVVCTPCSSTSSTGLTLGRYSGQPLTYIASATGVIDVVANVSIADGAWHQVDYTYNGSGTAAGVQMYVDGAAVSGFVFSDTLGSSSFLDPNQRLYIGDNTTGVAGDGTGLDDLSFYHSVLSPTDITAHYQSVSNLTRVDPATLYYVDDPTEQLSPRGNQAANWGDFLVSYRPDVPSSASSNPYPLPGTALTSNVCGTAGGSTPTSNTGLVCETDTPSSPGVAAGDCVAPTSREFGAPPTSSGYTHTCTTNTYNTFGEKIEQESPKAHSDGTGQTTKYTYYADTGTCDSSVSTGSVNCDLSGNVSAGSWLKAVTDPNGESVVYAYDRAGNTARTWDRNATHGKDLSAIWQDPANPPSPAYSESDMSNPVTSNSLSAGVSDVEIVRGDGTVSGSGVNSQNELGTATTAGAATSSATTPVRAASATGLPVGVVQIAQSAAGGFATTYFTVARTNTGAVYSWGLNSPVTQVTGLPPIISVAVGAQHVLALDNAGNVWAWGNNAYGQLGTGSTSNVTTPVKVLSGVSAISAGAYHSLAVKTDGSVWAWGNNATGQLGTGTTTNQSSPTQVPGLSGVLAVTGSVSSSYAIKSDGTVLAWGDNTAGALGTGSTASSAMTPQPITTLGAGTYAGMIRQIVGSVYGAAALTQDGHVYAWGYNNVGQLGGATAASLSSTPLLVPGVSGQVALAGGWATYLSANAAGSITIWGSTGSGQIGDGSTPSTSAPTATTTKYSLSPFAYPWRYQRGMRDAVVNPSTNLVDPAVGNVSIMVADPDGDTLITTPERGTAVTTTAFDTTSTYDAVNAKLSVLAPAERANNQPATTTYDTFGNAVVTDDPNGNATVTTFDAANRPSTVQTTRSTSANSAGAGCLGTSGNIPTASGAPWSSVQQGHVICTVSTTYDGNDDHVSVSDAVGATTKTTFDGLGRKIAQTVPRNDSRYTGLTTMWNYDVDGDVLDTCPPRQFDTATGHEPAGTTSGTCTSTGIYSTHTSYDNADRATSVTRYRGSMPLTTSTTYDADGNAVSTTDANQHTTTTTYDVLDRKTSQSVPRSAGVNETTSWNYDPSGNVTAVVAPGSLDTGTGGTALVVDGTTTTPSTGDGVVHDQNHPFPIPDNTHYSSVTLQNGGWITGTPTNGGTVANGLVFTATGDVTICASCGVSETGMGYAGGAGATASLGNQAGSDASNAGLTGNGGAGGGGTIGNSGGGGGGGGHQNPGGTASSGSNGTPGVGGGTSGQADFSDVGSTYLLGGGGGGGGGGQGLTGNPGGNGGNGGGFVHITASTITVNGSINADGTAGGSASTPSAGGGGGAGGGIWLSAGSVALASPGVLNVAGGAGGTGGSAGNGGTGGAGSVGDIRLDTDSVTNPPDGSNRNRVANLTAYSYDADNRPVDTLIGAQTVQADATQDNKSDAVPDPHGLYNTRTRKIYDPDGHVVAMLPPQAFTTSASLTAPNVDTAQRTDYDLDGRAVATYDPRYDTAVPDTGAGNDGGSGTNQQTSQCPTQADPTAVAGLSGYSSNVGVCVTRTSYDADSNVTITYLPTSNDHDNRYTCSIYSDDNLPLEVTGPDPSQDDLTGNVSPVCPTSTTASIGSNRVARTTTLYDGDRRPIMVTDTNGVQTATSYTADGLTSLVTTSPNGSITHMTATTYNANGQAITSTDPRGVTLDGNGNVDPTNSAYATYTTTTTYNSDGTTASIAAPGLSSGDYDTTTYDYDANGNPTTTLSPSANSMDDANYQLDSNGNKKVGLPTTDTFTYDNMIASSSVPTVSHPASAIAYRTTVYSYTPSGQKSATDIGICTSSTLTNCVPGNKAFNDGGIGTTRYTYAPDGLNIAQIGKQNATISTAYDQAGRPISISDSDTKTQTQSGSADDTITASYYLDGLLRTTNEHSTGSSAVYPDASTYAYDGAGALTARADTSGSTGVTAGATERTSYSYRDAGLVKNMSSDVHSGDATLMTYDHGGRLTQQTDSGGGTGQTITDNYNADNTLSSTNVSVAGTTVANDAYTYDDTGNILTQAVTGSAQQYSNTYTYNPAQNLTSYAHTVTTTVTTTTNTAYTWDHDSNRLTSTTTGGNAANSTTTWTYNPDNSIATQATTGLTSRSFGYNQAGLLTGDGCTNYGYDDYDRTLTATAINTSNTATTGCASDPTTTSYTYDGLDRQRTATVTGSTTSAKNTTTSSAYDGLSSTLIGQTNAATGINTKPTVLYQLDPTGTATAMSQTPSGGGTSVASLIDSDGNGSTGLLIDTTGTGNAAIACAAAYDPFGVTATSNNTPPTNSNQVCNTGTGATTTGNALWYQGDKRDNATGTYQLGTRTYNPATASFTTPDDYRVGTPSTDLSVGTDPDTANTYSYVNGNPINYDDPDGHCPTDVNNQCDPGWIAAQLNVPSPSAASRTGRARLSTGIAGRAFTLAYQSGVNKTSVFPALPFKYEFCGDSYANASGGPLGGTTQTVTPDCIKVPAGKALQVTRNVDLSTNEETGDLFKSGTWSDSFRFADPRHVRNGYGKLRIVNSDGTLNGANLSAVVDGVDPTARSDGADLADLKDSNNAGFNTSRNASLQALGSEYEKTMDGHGLSTLDEVGLGLGIAATAASLGALALPEGALATALGFGAFVAGSGSALIDSSDCAEQGGVACGTAALGFASVAFAGAGAFARSLSAATTASEADSAVLGLAAGFDQASFAAGNVSLGGDLGNVEAPTLLREVQVGLQK